MCVTQPAGPPSLIAGEERASISPQLSPRNLHTAAMSQCPSTRGSAGSIYSMDSAGLHYIPLTLTVTDPSGHIISQGNPEYVAFEEWLDDIPATTKGDYKFCIEGDARSMLCAPHDLRACGLWTPHRTATPHTRSRLLLPRPEPVPLPGGVRP